MSRIVTRKLKVHDLKTDFSNIIIRNETLKFLKKIF